MKKLLTILVALFISTIIVAQNGFNYKALVKDNNGDVLASTPLTIEFYIVDSMTTFDVYSETHATTTDANGIVNLVIGEGTTSGDFSMIDWAAGPYELNTVIDTGTETIDLGTSAFYSVPYASHAQTANSVANPVFFEPYILGVSSQTSNGRFVFNGKFGWEAANEMCKSSYPNEPYARAFTNEQITQAITIGSYSSNTNYNNRIFWAITSSTVRGNYFSNTSAGNNGLNLGFNSGDIARGTRGTIRFNYTIPGNGGGNMHPRYFNVQQEISLTQNYPCLCGTYKPATPN